MWHTPLGDRVLRGTEGKLFQGGLASLVDWLQETDGDYCVGVRVFDTLSLHERLAVLELVGRALLLEELPCPELTAVVEGAVAAVYEQVLIDVELEIEPGREQVRRLILATARVCEVLHADSPASGSNDMDEWSTLVDALTENIWDRDWEGQFVEPDNPPDLAEHVRDMIGIIPEYYTDVPPDPSPQRIQEIRKSLQALCRMEL
ncbi:MAG: hypothetical protein ABSH20_04430 [Tepidisphaeraceae bacterium]|jgi:hypothetical protein